MNRIIDFSHKFRRSFTIHFDKKGCINGYSERLAQLTRIEEVKLLSLDLLNGVDCPDFSHSVKETLHGKESFYHGSLTLKDLYFPEVDCRFFPYKNGNSGTNPGMIILEPNESILSKFAGQYSESSMQVEFLEEVINSMPQPLFLKDDKHQWIIFNKAALEMRGLIGQELKGKTDHEVFPREKQEIYWKYDDIAFEQGSSESEETITTAEGEIRSLIIRKNLIIDSQTGRRFLIGSITDITDFRRLETGLRESEIKYHDFFDNAYDYLITLDLEGNFTNASKSLLEGMKISLKELRKKSIFDFCDPEILDAAKNHFYGVVEKKENVPFEFKVKGTNRALEIRGKLFYKEGLPNGVQAIARDITERTIIDQELRKYSESLKVMNENKDKFYSIIAHDLKSPFNSLLGFSDMLFDEIDNLSKDEIRKYVSIIRTTARNTYNLVQNLLKWSSLQTGRMPFVPERLSPYAEINEVIDVLSSMAYRKEITILNETDRDVQILADPQMFQSIIENLLTNAIKYSFRGGTVKIFNIIDEYDYAPGNSTQGKFVTVGVVDNGNGMKDKDLNALFDFGTVRSNPGTAGEQGTGLGLKIAGEMVERCGGKIWADNNIPGQTTFFFTVPLS